MKKRDEISKPSSCLNKAKDNEPIFVLRANDELAPEIVLEWAQRYRESKQEKGKVTKEQQAKYDSAVKFASEMKNWKRAVAA